MNISLSNILRRIDDAVENAGIAQTAHRSALEMFEREAAAAAVRRALYESAMQDFRARHAAELAEIEALLLP